ncbi:Eukaryotic initiation factor 4A-II [Paramecium bursaria]
MLLRSKSLRSKIKSKNHMISLEIGLIDLFKVKLLNQTPEQRNIYIHHLNENFITKLILEIILYKCVCQFLQSHENYNQYTILQEKKGSEIQLKINQIFFQKKKNIKYCMDLNQAQEIEQNWEERVERFEELNLNKDLLRGIFAFGFENPSAIQQKAIKPIILGKDVLAQAQSGTGKTGTFTIGSLQLIDPNLKKTQVLILAPVRELAKQIYDVVKGIGQYMNIEAFCCIGGTSMTQTREKCQQGVHILIATPGRLIDMIKNKFLDAAYVKLLVIDEADQMLDAGFLENIQEILMKIPAETQIALFSATFPPEILNLSKGLFRENQLAKILVKKELLTLEGIRQFYIPIDKEENRSRILMELYKNLSVAQSILFCNSKKVVDDLTEKLKMEGFVVSKIHSQMDQKEREQVMKEFKNGAARILVSTDLMGRGIDVQQLSLVINYEFPRLKEQYLHRIGRAGRHGRKGVGINLVSEQQAEQILEVEKYYNTKIENMPNDLTEVEKELV